MSDVYVDLGELDQVPDRVCLMARADPEILDLAHAMLSHLWIAHHDVPDTARIRFETAVIEILGNIVEHAYQLDAQHPAAGSRRFQLALGATAETLVAVMGDNGLPVGLDLSAVVMPDAEAETGRGLPLAKAALDDLDYTRDGVHNQWTLRLHWTPT